MSDFQTCKRVKMIAGVVVKQVVQDWGGPQEPWLNIREGHIEGKFEALPENSRWNLPKSIRLLTMC